MLWGMPELPRLRRTQIIPSYVFLPFVFTRFALPSGIVIIHTTPAEGNKSLLCFPNRFLIGKAINNGYDLLRLA